MEANETNEALQEETIPIAEESSETTETPEVSTTPTEDTTGGGKSDGEIPEEQQNVDANENYLPVTFNHKSINLSREDATRYAQMGMKLEKLDPMLSKIDYLAAVNGKSRDEYIEGLLTSHDETLRKDLSERYGGDENAVNEMFEFTKTKNKKAYEDMIARQKAQEEADDKNARESTETRLAAEFAELVREFPDLAGKQFKDLPAGVRKAGYDGNSLLAAYLFHKHNEDKKAAAAAETAAKQNKASVGSMNSEVDSASKDEQSFLNGLWGR